MIRSAFVPMVVVALALAACGGGESSPTPESSAPPAGAPIPGGGLSIEEAIASTLGGPLMVKGYIVAVTGQPPRLCSALIESSPPECGKPSLVIEGLDVSALEELSREGDPAVLWSEKEISLLGTVENDTLTVSSTSI